jgi:hypothetical protein
VYRYLYLALISPNASLSWDPQILFSSQHVQESTVSLQLMYARKAISAGPISGCTLTTSEALVKHVDLASDSGAGLSYDLVTVFEWLEVRHRNLVDRHRKPPNLTSLPRRLIRDELLQVLHKLMNHYRPHGRLGLIQLSRVMSHGGRAHFFVLFSRTLPLQRQVHHVFA